MDGALPKKFMITGGGGGCGPEPRATFSVGNEQGIRQQQQHTYYIHESDSNTQKI